MKRIVLVGSALLALALFSSASQAAIQRVIVVESSNLPAYLQEIKTVQSQFKAAGIAVSIHAWRGQFAGSEAGELVITVEVADLATYAKLSALQTTDKGIAATMARIARLRKIKSDSIYEGLL